MPWHLLVLMEEAVGRGWAAFSQEEAKRRGVEWLDLARSTDLNVRLAELIVEFAKSGYRPRALQELVGEEDARKRWSALADFYKEHRHFLVTNGPYKLKDWSANGASLEVFRDLTYPLGVGSYDNYAVPRRGYIAAVEQKDGQITLSGDIELLVKHMRSYDLVRTPLEMVSENTRKRSAPECRYIITDSEGRVVLAGQAALADDANFHIDVSGKLSPGDFILLAQVIVNSNAGNTEIKRVPIVFPSNQ